MFQIKESEGVLVLGKRGSGKTELIKYLIRNLSPEYRFVILDIVGNLKEFEHYKNINYYQINPRDSERVEEICAKLLKAGKDYADKVGWQKAKEGFAMLVLDESDRLTYKGIQTKNSLSDIINLGRNYGIGYIASARRTSAISHDYWSQATHGFVFRHKHKLDLEKLEAEYGEDSSFFGALPLHVFAHFQDEDLEGEYKIGLRENTLENA